jgi:hypothetical protein
MLGFATRYHERLLAHGALGIWIAKKQDIDRKEALADEL